MVIGLHATHRRNLDRILSEGLRPDIYTEPGVHLSDGTWDPRSFILTFEVDDGATIDDIVTIEVLLDGLDVEEGLDGEGTWLVLETITPDRLKVRS